MVGLTWNDGKSRHFESALTQHAVDTAIETFAKRLEVGRNQILPIHRLGNAINFLSSLFPNAAVSLTSRKGALESFSGPQMKVDRFGRATEFPICDSFFVSAANQETGVIENVSKIKEMTNAISLVDATEWIGRRSELPAGDFLLARASSWGGSNSVCLLISNIGEIPVTPRQATSLSPSSFDLLYSATALDSLEDISKTENRIQNISSNMKSALASFENVTLHGDINSLPHLISFSIDRIDSETAAIAFDKNGIAVGSGSACSVAHTQSSHVLQAMGIKSAGNVRISIPLSFSETELEIFLEQLPLVMQELTQTL